MRAGAEVDGAVSEVFDGLWDQSPKPPGIFRGMEGTTSGPSEKRGGQA